MTSQWLLMLILGAQHWPHDAWYDQNENNSRRRNARSGQFADHWSTSSGHAYWTNFYAKHAKRAHSRRAGKLSNFRELRELKIRSGKRGPSPAQVLPLSKVWVQSPLPRSRDFPEAHKETFRLESWRIPMYRVRKLFLLLIGPWEASLHDSQGNFCIYDVIL